MSRGERGLLVALVASIPGCYTPSAAPLNPSIVPGRSAAMTSDPTAAADPASWDLEVDVDAAIAYALRHGPTTAERADVEAIAEAQIGAARQLTNPELRLGRTFESTIAGRTDEVSLGLRIHPDMPWARSAKIAEAQADHAAEQAHTAVARRDLAVEIRRLYAALAFGEATRDMFVRQLAVITERKRTLTAQLERGTTTKLEAVLADEDLFDLQSARDRIEVELVRTRGELARLLGVPAGQRWHPVWDLARLATITTTFDRRALTASALVARPELAEALHREEAAGARAYRERTSRVPWLDALQVERSVEHEVEWAVSVNITLPLLSQNGGAIAAADARKHGAIAARQRLAAATVQQIEVAIELAASTGQHARALAQRLAPLDQAIAELVAQENTAAVADPIKLLLLEERHVRVQRAVLDAAYEHRLAMIALDALTGRP